MPYAFSLSEADSKRVFTGILPGENAEVLQADVTLEADMNYDIFAVGNVGDESLSLLTVTSMETAVDAGNAQVQIVHAASMAPIKLIEGVPINKLKKRIKEVFEVTPKPKAINGAIITTGKLDNIQ